MKMKNLLYILTLILLSCFSTEMYSQAASLNGTWRGKVMQRGGSYSSEFEIEFYLKQDKEDKNKFFGYSKVEAEEIYAEYRVEGKFNPKLGEFDFKEVEMIRQRIPADMQWCQKSGILILVRTSKGLELRGRWWGETDFMTCKPDRMILKKVFLRA